MARDGVAAAIQDVATAAEVAEVGATPRAPLEVKVGQTRAAVGAATV